MPRILSVWLPLWPIRHRTSKGIWPDKTPRATVGSVGGQRCIEAASAEAQALGVQPGQSQSQARAICGELLTANADPADDLAALAKMARWCERLSPLTAPDPPDGLWIDITGCAHLLGGEEKLATRLRDRLAPCRIGISDTAGAAWALARSATRADIEIAHSGQHQAAIANLPVGLLRIEPRIVAGLQRVGLRSVEALLRLPRADITARFGQQPGQQLDRALGRAAEPITWQRPPEEWRAHLPFAEPIGTPEDLGRGLAALSEELGRRLEVAKLGGLRFGAYFIRVDGHVATLQIATASPLYKPSRLTRMLTDKLSQIDPGLGVEAMLLEAEEIAPLISSQPGLDAAPDAEDLTETLDTVTNHLGPEKLWSPVAVPSHIPERAVKPGKAKLARVDWSKPPGPRPVRLLVPPEPIDAIAPVPDDPPIRFRWRGALHSVRAASLPERIAAEWWRRRDPEEKFRDYYHVEDEHGARFWLFRTSLPGETEQVRWYLHGLFG